MTDDSRITDRERDVIESLVNAWNRFLHLPVEHSDDQLEFRQAIHAAQNIVLSRAGRRQMNDRGG